MALNIITSFLLCFWGMIYMTAPMMFGGPGASNNIKTYQLVLAVLYFPCYLFALYSIFDWRYFGYSALQCLVGGFVVITVACLFYLVPLFNLLRGIAPEGYSKSKDAVYFDGKEMQADHDSFTIPPRNKFAAVRSIIPSYALDKDHVYRNGIVLKGADPKGFHQPHELLDLWLNTTQVFFEGALVEGADPQNFTLIDEDRSYWHDGAKLYHEATFLELIDRAAISVKGKYLFTAKHVYYDGDAIPGADPLSFSEIAGQDGAAKDNFQVYSYGEVIQGAKPDSYALLSAGYARDESSLYYRHEKVNADVAIDLDSFEIPSDHRYDFIGFDKDNVYLLSLENILFIDKHHDKDIRYLSRDYVLVNEAIYYVANGQLSKPPEGEK